MNTYTIAACFFSSAIGFIATAVLFVKMDIKGAIAELRNPQNKAILKAAEKRKKAEKIMQEIGPPQNGTEDKEPELEFLTVKFKEPEKWPSLDVECIIIPEYKTLYESLIRENETTIIQPENGILLTTADNCCVLVEGE